MVGTFHTASPKQRTLLAAGPILEPIIEKLTARIAVSQMARATLREHFQTDAVVIPNGLETSKYVGAPHNVEWSKWHTIGFLGRFDEPRKGLSVLLKALPAIVKKFPDTRLLVAGPGDSEKFAKQIPGGIKSKVEFIGRLSEDEKAAFLKSVSVYVAPNTGGESFGIILTEAMAAGATILASDIPAFAEVLKSGRYGSLFNSEDSGALAQKVLTLFGDPKFSSDLSTAGSLAAQDYDWENVAQQISDVYELALASGDGVKLASENRSWKRFRADG